MLNSSYDGEIEQWDMIDKYSMNVIYTASVDIRRRMSAKKRSFDFVEFDTDLVGEQDIYPSEYVISDNSGHCCNVKNEWLYEAMLCLDDKLKEVLILKYWYLLSRRDIAKILNVSEKTITNWKNKAFKLIKNYKEKDRLLYPSFLEFLRYDKGDFVQVHRNYFVHKNCITNFCNRGIITISNTYLPMSRKYYKNIKIKRSAKNVC